MTTNTLKSSRGKWVVACLIAIGILGACITLIYWRSVADRQRATVEGGATITTPEGAGSRQWDPNAAAREILEVKLTLDEAQKSGQVTDAVYRMAERVVERYPYSPDAHRLVADVLLAQGRKAEAYDRLLQCLAVDNQQPDVHILAGVLALGADDMDAAARHYGVASQLSPGEVVPRLHLASLYLHQREYDKALKELLDARQLDADDHRVYHLIAGVYGEQRKWSLAVTNLQNALELLGRGDDRTRAAYLSNLAGYLNKWHRPEEALLTLDKLSADHRRQPYALEQRAIAHAMQRQSEQAAVLFEQASQARGFDPRMMVDAVRQWILAGNRTQADRALALLERHAPNTPEIEGLAMQLREMEVP